MWFVADGVRVSKSAGKDKTIHMLNIKTLIQSIYSYMVSNVKKSYKAFMAMTAVIIAGVMFACIGPAGMEKASADDEEFSDIWLDESETSSLPLLGAIDVESQTEENIITPFIPLAGSLFESIQMDIQIEQITGNLVTSENGEEDETSSETGSEDVITEDATTEEDIDKDTTVEIETGNASEEMSDEEAAAMLAPGDLFEGADGTILVANKLGLRITAEDFECLLKIVHAEAGNQGTKGKILVVNVIINRVNDRRYPSTIQGVVFQKSQFSPARKGGSYYYVTPNANTREAVIQALSGVDYSQGAIYFCGKSASEAFGRVHKFLFKHLGHYFYK